jgi:DNA primase
VGRNWMGRCPFHEEKTPSFSVNTERQFYHCFSCKAGGDVFKFVQETEKVGFLEAVELLSRRAGIPIPERRAGERSVRAPLLEALETAASAYEQWLADPGQGAAARGYLDSRGIARDTVRAFRLGLAPAGWENLLQRMRGRVALETLVQAGLVVRREAGRTGYYDRFRNRLMVPLIASGGAVLGFGARALESADEPKYLNSAESPVYHKGAFLYGLDIARRHVVPDGEMIVVEGYFDAIALHQAGLRHTVATSGTAFTPEQAKLLRRVAGRVALTYDGDRAGQEAMMRSLGTLLAEGIDVAVVDLPPGEDPDTLVRRGGVEAWEQARARASDPVEFVQRHVLRQRGVADPEEQALTAVVRLAAGIEDPIRRERLINRADEVFGVQLAGFRTALLRAVQYRRAGQDAERPLRAAMDRQRRISHDLERRLLQALLMAPEEIEAVRQRLSPEDFRDPSCGALALALWSGNASGESVLARELLSDAGSDLDWGAEAQGATRRMVERRLRQRLQERREQLKDAHVPQEAARLMQEIDEIARSLRDLSV